MDLQTFKKRKGLTNANLADLLKVSPATVSFWINGTVKPGLENIEALINSGMSFKEIFGVELCSIERELNPDQHKPITEKEQKEAFLGYLLSLPIDKALKILQLCGDVFTYFSKLSIDLKNNEPYTKIITESIRLHWLNLMEKMDEKED